MVTHIFVQHRVNRSRGLEQAWRNGKKKKKKTISAEPSASKVPRSQTFFFSASYSVKRSLVINDRHAGSALILKNSNCFSIDSQLVPGWDNWSPSSFETGKFDAFVPFFSSPFSGHYSLHLSYLKIPWFSDALSVLHLDKSDHVRPPLLSLTTLCRQ